MATVSPRSGARISLQGKVGGGAPAADTPQHGLLSKYCYGCHNEKLKSGGLVLEGRDITKAGENGEIWEKVVRKLRAGMMPPPGRPRPDVADQSAFVSWLENEVDRAAAANPNPGRTDALHRLNRTEYQNVVRDLLRLDVDVRSLLPPDDGGYGFDNIAGVLKVSQTLMERYVAVARKIAREAVGVTVPAAAAEKYTLNPALSQYEHVEGLPFGTRGGMLIHHRFPRDAEYAFRVDFSCSPTEAGGCDATAGFEDPHQVELTIDGERVHIFKLEPTSKRGLYHETRTTSVDTRYTVQLPVKAGVRDVGIAFLRLPSYEPTDWPRQRHERPVYTSSGNMFPEGLGVYQPHMDTFTVAGPFSPVGGPGNTPSRQQIFACSPTQAAEEAGCATKILTTIARRAYRRPVTETDVRPLLAFYNQGRREEGFEAGIELALRRILVSPEFLFRTEFEPDQGHANYAISDLELASRLSFFIWSSIPDDELLDVAAKGKLKEPATLTRQVQRMLKNPKSEALTNNFMAQWLGMRRLDAAKPDDDLFPDFDQNLREAFRKETELFFHSIMQEDRSVMELLNANYTFVNDRLARQYGLPNINGSQFRRVTLSEDSPRRGILGQGSILTITSHAIRTSPVIRGKWIMETILGSSPPPPPANVPPLEEKKGAGAALSMRERMAAHRANPVCAACHSMIDPLGFALENFDPVGKWRDFDQAMKTIDASGALPDGTKFQNLAEFKAALVSQPDRFVTGLTENLMTYALGRGLEYYDMPAVRKVVRNAAKNDYRFSSLILGVVQSLPFDLRRSSAVAATSASRH